MNIIRNGVIAIIFEGKPSTTSCQLLICKVTVDPLVRVRFSCSRLAFYSSSSSYFVLSLTLKFHVMMHFNRIAIIKSQSE